MAGQTVRDVVIRLKIEQQAATVKVPSPAGSAGSSGQSGILTGAQAAKLAQKEQNEAAKQAAQAERQKRKEIQDTEKAQAKAAENLNRISEGMRREQEKQVSQQRQMSNAFVESFNRAGEGAFRLARGVALLGVDADKDLKKVVETISKVQAGFDLFKGTADVVRGITEGFRLMRAASLAASAAETTRTVATTAATVATEEATVAATGLQVALGPIGWISLAIGAAAAALTIFSGKTKEATQETNTWSDALGVAIDRVGELRSVNQEIQQIKDSFSGLNEGQVGAQIEKDMQGTAKAMLDAGAKTTELTDSLQAAEKKAADLRAEANRWKAVAPNFAADKNNQAKTQDEVAFSLTRDATVAAAAQVESVKDAVEARRRSLEFVQKEGQALQQQLETARSILDATQKNALAKKQEFESAEAKFGRLSKQDQEFIKSVDKKLAGGGQLSEAELRKLESTGFGGRTAEAAFRKRGEQAGFGGLQALGDQAQDLQKAEQDAQQASNTFGQAINDLTDQIVENKDREAKAIEELVGSLKYLDNVTQAYKKLSDRLKALEKERAEAVK